MERRQILRRIDERAIAFAATRDMELADAIARDIVALKANALADQARIGHGLEKLISDTRIFGLSLGAIGLILSIGLAIFANRLARNSTAREAPDLRV